MFYGKIKSVLKRKFKYLSDSQQYHGTNINKKEQLGKKNTCVPTNPIDTKF